MAQPLKLYNTLSRQIELLEPLTPPEVRIYTCGPTVYSHLQLGNYRAYIAQDILVKTLRYFGYQPHRVMNITDVGHLTSDEDEGEDKLEVGAKREGTTAWEVAKKYQQVFLQEINELNIEQPAELVRATDTIKQQIEFIRELEAKGYTYKTADGIYFDSSKVADYGKLAHLDIAGLQAGARVEVREGKRRVTDFALWKFSETPGKRDMEWESPWGVGFPGWHIECSAIALDRLGPELDIHAGGVDHIPVHHTNEIAQSESLTQKPLAHIWFHNEFLLVDGGKMGKSLGNAYTLDDLKKRGITPLAFRFFTYSASYRSKLNFTWEAMEAAATSLSRLKEQVNQISVEASGQLPDQDSALEGYVQRTDQALAADLNIPEVVAILWEIVRSSEPAYLKLAYIQRYEPILSLGLLEAEELMQVPDDVWELVDQREKAREEQNWSESDRLRALIREKGYDIEDVGQGKSPRLRAIRVANS